MVPIVRNLYKSRRQILWGFTLSLISRDLLKQYSWTGRGDNSLKKRRFELMKHIQSVLWCAMVKISPSYSVKEFEDDFKTNLAKCASQTKAENDEQQKQNDEPQKKNDEQHEQSDEKQKENNENEH